MVILMWTSFGLENNGEKISSAVFKWSSTDSSMLDKYNIASFQIVYKIQRDFEGPLSLSVEPVLSFEENVTENLGEQVLYFFFCASHLTILFSKSENKICIYLENSCNEVVFVHIINNTLVNSGCFSRSKCFIYKRT